jgi:hypothetical protein
MTVNWFEGGRRIRNLFMGSVIAVGAITVLWRDDPDPVLSIRGPTMPWFVSEDTCAENAYVRNLWDYEWGGEKPGLRLCFLSIDGDIPYEIAPTPPEALQEQARVNRENELRLAKDNKKRMAKGEPLLVQAPPMRSPWFYTAPAYDEKVEAYVTESISNLRITPELATRLKGSLSSVRWNDRKKALNDAFPWVAGICGFLWAFALAMGWIVRGFAGIPAGQDFKPIKEEKKTR